MSILGHGGHGQATPPPPGNIGAKPTGYAPDWRRRPGDPARRPIGARISHLAAASALNPTHIANAISLALEGKSAMEPWAEKVKGLTPMTTRRLINNIMDVNKKLVYAEAGSYCGATAAAAVSGRENVTCYAYDNFAHQWHDDKPEWVRKQMLATSAKNKRIHFAEGSFFAAELPPRIDVFLYDGDHSEQATYDGLPYVVNNLAPVSLFMMDDHNWPEINRATKNSLRDMDKQVRVAARWDLHGTMLADDPKWQNGFFMALLVRIDQEQEEEPK